MVLEELSALAAAAAIRRGELRAETYAEALLERCRRAAHLNAFIALDGDAVLESARAADQARTAGRPLGPLHGVPLVLKDNIDTAQMATTAGTPALKSHRPRQNAPVAERLFAAGALLLGKANMHELAFGITSNNAAFGPVRNPYDPTRIAGGSSGGTGAAIAARLAPAGLGTDTGGSVRIPAALTGIAGLRPTAGRWPQAGIVPISHTRDTPGPMARSLADCALLDRIVTGEADDPAPRSLKGLRLGVPRGYFWADLDGELAVLLEAALDRLRAAGALLIEGDIPDVEALDAAAGFPIALHEARTDLDAYLRGHDSSLDFAALAQAAASPDVRGILGSQLGAGRMPDDAYHAAMTRHRPALQAAYRDYFRSRDVSAVVFPTTPLPAVPLGQDETVSLNGRDAPIFVTFIRNTGPGSLAGIPGLTLPAGLTASGLPVGIEFDAPAGHDRDLLAIGLAAEAILPPIPAPKLAADATEAAAIRS